MAFDYTMCSYSAASDVFVGFAGLCNKLQEHYALGSDDKIFYDEAWILLQSVAMHYAFIGSFGQFVVENLKCYDNTTENI